MPRFTDQTALVTGATSGIGEGIARALAAEGAFVAVHGRDAARGGEVVAAITDAGGRAVFVAADLAASAEEARALASDATAALGGRVDLLVNNAGVYPSGPTADLTDADLERLLAVNVRAPHVLVAALAPAMAARGDGTIVNVGSWIATVGLPQGALYGATKAAIEQLTRAWAAELGPSGVRVNAVSPGITLTPGNAAHQHLLDAMVQTFPARRIGTADEVAEAVLFLASEAAGYMHGSILLVDGGALSTRG
jgi:3-oxoacyl-[acyl-carrier protein] reductase